MYKKIVHFSKNWHSFSLINNLISIKGINFGKVFELYLSSQLLNFLETGSSKKTSIAKLGFFRNAFLFPGETIKLIFYFFLYHLKRKTGVYRKIKNPVLVLARQHALFELLPLLLLMKKKAIGLKIIIWGPSKKEWLFLFKNDLDFIILDNKEKTDFLHKIYKEKQKLLHNWQTIKKNGTFDKFLKKEKLTTEKNKIKKTLDNFFSTQAYNFCSGIVIAEQIFKQQKPSLFISTNDLNPLASIFVYTFKKNKKPTLTLQHGIIYDYFLSNFISDKMAVWGNLTKKIFVTRLKKKPESINVTGSLFFDKTYPNYKYVPRFSGLKRKIKIYGIFTTIYDNPKKETKNLINTILSLKNLKHAKISIRTHPGQRINSVVDYINKLRLKVAINEPVSLKKFIMSSDLILAQDTTAGLEAILLGKPLVYLNLMGEKDNLPYAKLGAAIGVYKNSELFLKINKFLSDRKKQDSMKKNQEKFIKNFLLLEGKSATRILDLVIKLTKPKVS